jgi:hypothetical protein
MTKAQEGGPTVANRWWVDTDETAEPVRGERPAVGSRFFDIGYAFDQERAKHRLTDINLKFLDEVRPDRDEWRLVRLVAGESVPVAQIERCKRRLPLPPGARGVVLDSGRSVRFIMTGDPVGERVLEFTLGEESSFDCWIRGDWVREESFRDLDDALHHAPPIIAHYLGLQMHADNDIRA